MSQVQITPAQVRARADELRAQNAQLKAQIELLDETEQSLNTMWEGEARNAFHNAFQTDKTQMTNFYNEIQKYATVLEEMASRYEQAEQLNIETATTRKA
jgi:WXG100 family type VII secretion target